MIKNIRIGNTEMQLILIKKLTEKGYKVPEYIISNFLWYSWKTMGWYDKNHLVSANKNDFTYEKDFTDNLKIYINNYFQSLQQSNELSILPAILEMSLNFIKDTIKCEKEAKYFTEEFMADFNSVLINEYFSYAKLYEYSYGRNMVVISPFAEIFKKQYEIGNVNRITPNFKPLNCKFIKYPYCLNNTGPDNNTLETINNWLKNNEKLIYENNTEIVVASIGASGPIILDKIYKNGISIAYPGGDLQLIFGVMGGRWRDAIINSMEYKENKDSWLLAPPEEFIPDNSKEIENRCYW
jgi:hypothetical protein